MDGSHMKMTQAKYDAGPRTYWKAHSRAQKSPDTEADRESCCVWDSSRDLICALVSLPALRHSRATLSGVKALNKLFDQVRSTAGMGIVIPCGVVNLKTCSVICHTDAAFADAEGEKSQCCLVVGLTHHPDLVKGWTF